MKKIILRFAVSALLLTALFSLFAIPALAASYTGVANTGNMYELEIGDTLRISNPYSASDYDLIFPDYYWRLKNKIGTLSAEHGKSTTFTATLPGTTTIYGELTGMVEIKVPQVYKDPFTGKTETRYNIVQRKMTYQGTATIKVSDTLAPEIVSQPRSTHAASGETVSVAVTASDHSALNYQWYYYDPQTDEALPLSCTKATYSCTMSSALDGRQVCCMVGDAHGNYTQTDWVRISLLGITQQPKEAVAELGTVASTSLKAEGSGLTYQWYIAKKGSSSFSKSSITKPTYSVKLTADNTGRQAYCVITNQYGQSIRSNTVTLRKPVTVKFTTQPQSKFAADGKTVSTTVKAQGDGLTYQWYYKNAGASKFSKASITGPTYSVKMDASRSGRQIYCVVTDKFGDSVKSKTVTIARFAITKQPANVYVDAGIRASTSVTAEGDGLKYQWYVKDPGASAFTKSSITGNTYGYTMTKAKDGRQVYCVITDQYGNTLTTKTVTLKTPDYAAITSVSAVNTALSGGNVSATVNTAGDELKYQWYIKSPTGTSFSKSSITGKTYSYAMTQSKSGRQAYCIITDRYGNSVRSKTFTFSLLGITDQNAVLIAGNGGKVSASVKVTGEGLKYQWYIKGATGSSFSKSSITASTYSYTMTQEKSGRQAYCIITDKWGNSVRSDTFTFSLLQITSQPADNCAGAGKTVSVSVDAQGDGLKYQWYYQNANASKFSKASITGKTYSVEMNTDRSGRKLYCVVTDKWGNSVRSNTALISLLAITQQPQTAYASINTPISTTIVAEGEGLTYTWYSTTSLLYDYVENTSLSPETTTFTRTFSDYNSGVYAYCVVKNQYGHSVRSKMFSLSPMYCQYIWGDAVPEGETTLAKIVMHTYKPTYTWYAKAPGESSFKLAYEGKNNDIFYKCTMTPEIDGTELYCVVTNNFGAVYTSKTVHISMLDFGDTYEDIYVKAGEKVTLTLKNTIGQVKGCWWTVQKDGSYASHEVWRTPENDYTFTFTAEKSQDGSSIKCMLTNDYGNSYSRTLCYLHVK